MSPTRSRLAPAFAIIGFAFLGGGALLARSFRGPQATAAGERLFDQVVDRIEKNFVDSVPPAILYQKALTGLLGELGDPHTAYLPPDRLKRLTESTSGIYTGLGVRVDPRDGWPTVIAPLPGGPAERAGLLAGDRIVEIDGRSTESWTDDEIRSALRGESGAVVKMLVQRPTVDRRIPVEVVRGEVHRAAVRRRALLADSIGYIDLKIFSDSTERELIRGIDSLRASGARALVLDLRANPGGLLTQGVAVADLFLDPGKVIVSIRGRSPDSVRTYADSVPQRWPEMPLALLVDDATASAAEIVAGALQDHDRAIVIGHVTYGKGSAQAVFQTVSGGGLKLTTARWYTPLGRSIERLHVRTGERLDAGRDEKTFRTTGGREIRGGLGGIVPDVEDIGLRLSTAELALQHALGDRMSSFRDALTAFAIGMKGRKTITSPDFPITEEMHEAFWRLLVQRGFTLDRRIYDGARPVMTRLLAREIARYVIGPDGEMQRSIRDDSTIQRAAQILRGAVRASDVFRVEPSRT